MVVYNYATLLLNSRLLLLFNGTGQRRSCRDVLYKPWDLRISFFKGVLFFLGGGGGLLSFFTMLTLWFLLSWCAQSDRPGVSVLSLLLSSMAAISYFVNLTVFAFLLTNQPRQLQILHLKNNVKLYSPPHSNNQRRHIPMFLSFHLFYALSQNTSKLK